MKNTLLALGTAVLVSGCAGAKVTHTDIATGAHSPKAIYIRSYIAEEAPFKGHHGASVGEHPIRRSLAPVALSRAIKEEMEKMAPARVLECDEIAPTGWLVESNIEYAHNGSQTERALVGFTEDGRSCVKVHVRVIDVEGRCVTASDKDMSKGRGSGNVIYEFDVVGSSNASGAIGSIYAPGLGNPEQFDYRNIAERVYYALSVDPHRYGSRSSLTINY